MSVKPKAIAAPDSISATPALPAPTKPVASLMAPASAAATTGLDQTPAAMKQGVDRAMKTAEQFAQFYQGNFEAMVKSGQIWATGLQDLTKHMAGSTQAALEEGVSTFRAITSAKSLKEAMDLQTSYAKTSFEKALAEGGKLTETSLKLAEEVAAPLTARVNAAVEAFTAR